MIKGKRITLRALERSDLAKMWRWENDTEVMEFASSAPERCVSFEAIVKSYETTMYPDQATPRRLVIMDEKGEGIGIASYWVPNPRFSRSAEIGIYIGEKGLWHYGYGTDTIMTLGNILFRELNFHRVAFSVGGHNERMLRTLQRCGLTTEGIIREERYMHGRYIDTLRFGWLRDEFEMSYSKWICNVGKDEVTNETQRDSIERT